MSILHRNIKEKNQIKPKEPMDEGEIVREITLDVMWMFIFCHLCWLNQQKYVETKKMELTKDCGK